MAHSSFSFENFDLIGFDLDNCLVEYDFKNMSRLVYDILCRYLVREKGYDGNLTKTTLDFEFMQKGLFLDFQRGNILKLSPTGKVLKAFHGTQRIENIQAIYGEECIWDTGKKYTDNPLAAWNGPLSEKIRSVLDTFDMPAGVAYARLVDLAESPDGNFYRLWEDIVSGLYYMYDTSGFALNKGEYFPELKNNPTKFIRVLPRETVQWLQELHKKKGKFVCLITGSANDFANFTSSHAIGPDWKELFDAVIYFARKPAFFIQDRPFVNADTKMDCSFSDDVTNISQGSWNELTKVVSSRLGKKSIRSVYIGDNMIQDVFAPASHGCCDAVAICDPITDGGCSSYWGESSQLYNGQVTFWHSIVTRYAALSVSSVNDLAKIP